MYIDNYKQIPIPVSRKTRNFARNRVLDILSLTNGFSEPTKPRIQFLYFHHVFKNEEKKLSKLLNTLSKHHSFISYSQAIEKLKSGEIDKPYICFSSDDGFKNNLRSVEIFKNFGISACYFICPSIINNKNFNEVKEFCKNNLHLPPVEFLNWKDIEEMQKNGHEIGSHTMSHLRISSLSDEQINYELETSKSIIQEKTGVNNIHFAYPYGLEKDINQYAINKVHQLGYESCASAVRGVHLSKVNIKETLVKRDHVIFDWNIKHIEYFLLKNCK